MFFVVYHQPIMSFCQWSSVLGCQRGISFTLCASTLLDELVIESSGNEEFSLDEENSGNSSSSNSISSL